MSDITDKLRAYGGDYIHAADGYRYACMLMVQAADRIKVLEDALNAIATRSRTISSAKAVAIYALGNDYCEDKICEKDHI
jgi:hypothetical protein